ncbi:MAG: hypothetical protein ACI80I_003225 [Akkermansiaceae bacterium]|jgi:hypothetical protein
MIINKVHDFGFVHIPKCAGSTVRQQLRDRDDLNERFYHTIQVPDFTKINGNHTQLSVLKQYFPDDFDALRAVTSYAITRDPLERFVSSVAQYLRSTGVDPGSMRPAEILQNTRDIITALRAPAQDHVIRHTIFFPQVDYVYLEGEKIVDHVYTIEHMDAFFDRLETQHDLHLIRDKKWNPTVTYRMPAMSGRVQSAKKLAQKYLPMKAYVSLREVGLRMLTTPGAPKLEQTLHNDAGVRAFVAEHYAADWQLYRDTKAVLS